MEVGGGEGGSGREEGSMTIIMSLSICSDEDDILASTVPKVSWSSSPHPPHPHPPHPQDPAASEKKPESTFLFDDDDYDLDWFS